MTNKKQFIKGPPNYSTSELGFDTAYKSHIKDGRLYIELSHSVDGIVAVLRAAMICETVAKLLEAVEDEKLFSICSEHHHFYFNGRLSKDELHQVYNGMKDALEGIREIHKECHKNIMNMMMRKEE